MIRVFVCDDTAWYCELVAAWFEPHDDLSLVGCAHDRASALAELASARPHVVVLDTMTFGLEPIAVADVRDVVADVRVLLCSGYPAEFATRLLGDADGYVSKIEGEIPLIAGIRRLAGR